MNLPVLTGTVLGFGQLSLNLGLSGKRLYDAQFVNLLIYGGIKKHLSKNKKFELKKMILKPEPHFYHLQSMCASARYNFSKPRGEKKAIIVFTSLRYFVQRCTEHGKIKS